MKLEALALARLDGVAHGFLGRRGGVSEGPFASLNVSLRNADDTANALENRRRAVAALGQADHPLLIARQVHGTRCAIVEAAFDPLAPPEADALATATPGLVLGVTTADCAPVLFADPAAGVVAAAHAGWRGAKDGILEATVEAMRRLGAVPGRTVAAIGPCIAVASYEVGAEFETAFLAAEPESRRFFRAVAAGQRHFDLAGYCVDRLARAGIATVERLDRDTCAEAEDFFSYRRATRDGERHFGLQVAAISRF
ncbi:MAG: peptidoglycan editing factor PgeF [Geminicoccaceae bacterium]|jgi:YfiH family protein|nr:peptidoglycan editing factor PgeF [Geminicoccaceae bacterium]MCB9969074.1 peptidoglycan editing factor PgeF [Geminicoccaceae bacterium]